MASRSQALCLALTLLLVGAAILPQVQAGGGLRMKKLFIGYMLAKAMKPRFIPIPLPLPLPIKLGKDRHVTHPVHTHSHSAHAQLVHDPWQGQGLHHGGGGGGGLGGEGWW